MNRSLRFFVVLVILLVIAGGVLIVMLSELERASDSSRDVDVVLTNPVYDVTVGDWVEYRREDGKVEVWLVVEGSARTYSYSLLTSAVLTDGSTVIGFGIRLPQSKWDLGLGTNFSARSYRPEKVTVAGREWDSWRVEHDSFSHGKMTSWISDEVPLGLLRRELDRRKTADGFEYNFEYVRHGSSVPAVPKAGDWAEYRRADGTLERHEVASIGMGVFTLKVTSPDDASTTPRSMERPLGMWNIGLGIDWKLRSFQAVSLTLAGRGWETARMEFVKDMGKDVKPRRVIGWIAPDHPLGLIRRQTIDGPDDEGPPDIEYVRHE